MPIRYIWVFRREKLLFHCHSALPQVKGTNIGCRKIIWTNISLLTTVWESCASFILLFWEVDFFLPQHHILLSRAFAFLHFQSNEASMYLLVCTSIYRKKILSCPYGPKLNFHVGNRAKALPRRVYLYLIF